MMETFYASPATALSISGLYRVASATRIKASPAGTAAVHRIHHHWHLVTRKAKTALQAPRAVGGVTKEMKV
jgi:hypothetical protein